MTEPHQTLVAIVYVLGVLLTPFFFSLIDGWPVFKPRDDDEFTGLAVVCCLLWPGVLLVWLLVVWWCGASWLGCRARRLLDAVWRRLRR